MIDYEIRDDNLIKATIDGHSFHMTPAMWINKNTLHNEMEFFRRTYQGTRDIQFLEPSILTLITDVERAYAKVECLLGDTIENYIERYPATKRSIVGWMISFVVNVPLSNDLPVKGYCDRDAYRFKIGEHQYVYRQGLWLCLASSSFSWLEETVAVAPILYSLSKVLDGIQPEGFTFLAENVLVDVTSLKNLKNDNNMAEVSLAF